MKIPGQSGEAAFRCLIEIYPGQADKETSDMKPAWGLSKVYFFSKEEVLAFYPHHKIKWPVELIDNSYVYVPSEDEFDEPS